MDSVNLLSDMFFVILAAGTSMILIFLWPLQAQRLTYVHLKILLCFMWVSETRT